MKYLLCLLLLASFIDSNSQKGLKTEISKNTGDTIFSTPEHRLYIAPGGKNAVSEYLKSTIYRVNGNYKICFSIQTGRTNIFSIGENDEAVITLEDGKKIVLRSVGDHRSHKSVLDYGCYLFAWYFLPASALQQLKQSSVSSVKINASLGPMDYPLKGKFAKVIADQLARFEP